MQQSIKVGIIGDFDPNLRYHGITNEALNHAATALSVSVEPTWLPTQSLAKGSVRATLSRHDALWCAPGDYESSDGALQAINFAREQRWPFIGT